MQRTLIITATVIVLLGVGVVAYFYFANNSASIAVAPAGSSSLPTAGEQAPPSTNTATSSFSPTGTPATAPKRLVQISTGPVVLGENVADIKAVSASSSPDVAVSYIARESGNVFSYLTRAGTLTRTSNRTLPGIQTASWLPDGSLAFVRYLSGANFSTTNTYALPANGTGGFFMPQNISDIAVSSTSILSLVAGVNGSSASLSHTDGTKSAQLFTTPLSALRASFAGKNKYLVFTKPAASLPGYAYIVDGAGSFSRIAGPRNGLVALASPLGKWVLASYADAGVMRLELINTATGESLPLPVSTIADKCVWTADDSAVFCGIPMDPSSNYAYPDDWYQGAVQFSDRIWKIDTAGRYAQLVLDFNKETKGQLDAEAIAVDQNNSTLVFVNKNDLSLWVYSL